MSSSRLQIYQWCPWRIENFFSTFKLRISFANIRCVLCSSHANWESPPTFVVHSIAYSKFWKWKPFCINEEQAAAQAELRPDPAINMAFCISISTKCQDRLVIQIWHDIWKSFLSVPHDNAKLPKPQCGYIYLNCSYEWISICKVSRINQVFFEASVCWRFLFYKRSSVKEI